MRAASVIPGRMSRALLKSAASTVVLSRMRFMPLLCHNPSKLPCTRRIRFRRIGLGPVAREAARANRWLPYPGRLLHQAPVLTTTPTSRSPLKSCQSVTNGWYGGAVSRLKYSVPQYKTATFS